MIQEVRRLIRRFSIRLALTRTKKPIGQPRIAFTKTSPVITRPTPWLLARTPVGTFFTVIVRPARLWTRSLDEPCCRFGNSTLEHRSVFRFNPTYTRLEVSRVGFIPGVLALYTFGPPGSPLKLLSPETGTLTEPCPDIEVSSFSVPSKTT